MVKMLKTAISENAFSKCLNDNFTILTISTDFGLRLENALPEMLPFKVTISGKAFPVIENLTKILEIVKVFILGISGTSQNQLFKMPKITILTILTKNALAFIGIFKEMPIGKCLFEAF